MSRRLVTLLLGLGLGAFGLGCGQNAGKAPAGSADQAMNQGAGGETAGAPADGAAPFIGQPVEVVETMSTAGYTYVNVKQGEATYWAAGPEFECQPGDKVVVSDGMPMPNYHSKSLDRDFDVVYFASSILPAGQAGKASAAAAQMPAGHPTVGGKADVPTDFSDVTPADGGDTIAALFGKRESLQDKDVLVRGKVVKVNNGIMGRNWFHIQDGTGAGDANDLTVTTDATVKVGDVVLVKGTAAVDKDFGAGYKYGLIVEKAEVTVE